ncbi:calcium ion binding protein [Rhynchospora pubera]|uniref:Calcium ion binding protein n=1 Tax=Rhynchospora pubera TaxID=906938 RepID=A0AAV8DDG7_9POAL|nr:calcium ion binding protein [Rhynchospora pubera]
MTRYSAVSTDADADADAPPSPTSSPSAASDLPLSQKLIKVIGNVCFSFFVLAVLVVTVIAVTYQPPDPWLSSSAALTTSLSATLQNSTFRPDDSVLPTGEDLVPLNSSLIPVNSSSSPSASSVPDLVDSSSTTVSDEAAASESCDPDKPVNCSDPRVLNAVKAFNQKAFTRRSIIFLSYDIPVPGSKPGECDVAWRFRNRKEKSWRRYRDYRRFRLAPGGNCTIEVSWVGKFRSGTNAAKSRPRTQSPASSTPVKVLDSEINDTIPTVGSESEFKRGKYLYYTRGGDYCKSMNQFIWSFLCGLGEAQFLNRTFVVDLSICLSGAYNPWYGKDEEGKDFRFYFDFEHLKESASIVEEEEFLRDWRRWDKKSKSGNKISVRKVPTYKVTPMQLKKDKSTVLWRQFDGPEPENYWYRVCEGRAAKYIQRPWQAIWKSKRLMNIVTQIAGKMEWDYDAVHVVRGWKAQNKQVWPNLDADTSPDALVDKMTKLIPPWRNLYIATNEPFYNYFDKLRSHYKVHLLDDYKEMWGANSEWYNETMELNGGKPVPFDGYMRVAVDTEVLYRAKTRVETFNNLTRDCKDGINTC